MEKIRLFYKKKRFSECLLDLEAFARAGDQYGHFQLNALLLVQLALDRNFAATDGLKQLLKHIGIRGKTGLNGIFATCASAAKSYDPAAYEEAMDTARLVTGVRGSAPIPGFIQAMFDLGRSFTATPSGSASGILVIGSDSAFEKGISSPYGKLASARNEGSDAGRSGSMDERRIEGSNTPSDEAPLSDENALFADLGSRIRAAVAGPQGSSEGVGEALSGFREIAADGEGTEGASGSNTSGSNTSGAGGAGPGPSGGGTGMTREQAYENCVGLIKGAAAAVALAGGPVAKGVVAAGIATKLPEAICNAALPPSGSSGSGLKREEYLGTGDGADAGYIDVEGSSPSTNLPRTFPGSAVLAVFGYKGPGKPFAPPGSLVAKIVNLEELSPTVSLVEVTPQPIINPSGEANPVPLSPEIIEAVFRRLGQEITRVGEPPVDPATLVPPGIGGPSR